MEELQSSQLETYNFIKKQLENFKKSPKDRLTKANLETRLELLESYWEKFQSKHDALAAASGENRSQLSYFKNNINDDCMESYLDLKTRIKEKLNAIEETARPVFREMPRDTRPHSPGCNIKLPPIQIPKFSGEYKDWISYHDLFKSLIIDNETLSKVNKCQYLKSSLQGEAENLVRQIPVTDASYEMMWETLKKRYNNRRYIVNSYIGRVLNMRKINNETPKALKEILDITSECLTSLKAIDIPTDHWDDIIVYIVIQKLDAETHRHFEQRIETLERLPTWKDLSEFLELRFRTLEAVKCKDTQPHTRNATTAKSLTASVTSPMNCVYCKADHKIYTCKNFSQLEVNERQQFILKNNMCFNCLRKGHSVRDCKQSSCRTCGRKHHTLLHGYSVPAGPTASQATPQNSQSNQIVNLTMEEKTTRNNIVQEKSIELENIDRNNSAHNSSMDRITMRASIDTSPVILATALVKVQSKNHSIHILRALVDQGSQASLITEGACQALGLKRAPILGNIVGVSSNNTVTKALVEFEITSRHDPNKKIKVSAYVLRTLTSYIPQRVQAVDWPELECLQLADNTFKQPGRVDLLLGAEIFADIIQQGIIVHRDEKSSLVAQETSLGWLISGNSKKSNNQQPIVVTHHAKIEIETTLRRFWELEEPVPEKRIMTNDEKKCEKHYKTTHRKTIEGRYEVRLPFAVNPPDLGESASIAIKRLASVEQKFKTHPDLHHRYTEFMQDYLDQNHMELVSAESKPNNSICYLPHHAVINEQHLTTKLRVVFDASAKTSNGKSLNDNLLIGPTLQGDLRDTTLRWRRHATVLVGDIRQMYRQIRTEESDRDFQRIVWRWTPDEPIKHYRLLTVTYGTSCAPYLAIKTLKQLADDEKGNFPEEVIDALSSDFYVDDLLTGAPTIEKAVALKTSLTELLNKGGFVLHKWASNCSLIENSMQGKRKILGLDWNDRSDKFELKFEIKNRDYEKPTKRTILQDIAKLYDPAGWLAPVVVRAKVLMQKLWAEGLDWDDQLPETLETEWLIFRKNLCNMPTIDLDRWIGMTDNMVNVEIHGFSDASDSAYSAVVYCRTILPDTVKITLIEAKTKVAPIKKISTPRLELCGAVLLAKLIDRIKTALNVPDKDIYAWTDATIVLAWLQRPSSYWNTFVANRVTEITNRIDQNRWHHVASQDNPADVASRGICPLELQSHELWWNGPQWLRERRELPVKDISAIINPTEDEKRSQVKVQCSVVVSPESEKESDIINRHSNLNKLVRVVSYCLRFYYKCKSKAKGEILPVYTPYLTSVEMQNALSRLVKLSQGSESINQKNIKNLNPFIDTDQILKVGGRIQNACCNKETKHPTILAKNSRLAYLIVKEAHVKTLHGGVQLMLNNVRNRYHIIGVKHIIKKILRECTPCCRHSNKPVNQLMGTLPKDRVTPQKPFLVSGVDFAGPIILKLFSGRGSNRTQKAYIALFICTVTKAVHIELVTSLSTECFLAAFRRFTARRGHCKKLISDCGTNFIGAIKELEIMANKSISNVPIEIAELLALDGTSWQLNPAGAPHMGGLWESNIKSIKRHLNRVIGDSKLTYEEYSTLLCQIESCLNSRPLTSLDNEKEGTTVALTPGHFLISESPIVVPDENFEETQYVPYNKRWIYLQKKLQSFWRQWSQEYLVTLQKRQKWTSIQTNLKVGNIVLVKDERLPPTKWLLGKIIEVHPGSDGLVRVVSLKCKNSVLKRPIHKLCLLPTENEPEDVISS